MYNFGDTRPMLSQTKVFPLLSFQIPHNVGQAERCTVNVLGTLKICFCKQSTGKNRKMYFSSSDSSNGGQTNPFSVVQLLKGFLSEKTFGRRRDDCLKIMH